MNKLINHIYFIALFASAVFLNGCSDKEWDNHTESTITANMMSVLESDPDLSIFCSVLKKTGYDEVLSLPVNYTVFAPENSAWSGIDTTDVSALTDIVAYQICKGKNLSTDANIYEDMTMMNTKHVRYDSSTSTFEDASIVTADNVAGNGVVHVMDKIFTMKDNIYEYITSTYPDLEQVQYLISLNTQAMDTTKSVEVGSVNGEIVYDTVWTNVNSFLEAYPIDNEDSIMTYVVLQDAGFDQLYTKYEPYFTMASDSATSALTNYNICQDFVISMSGKVDISQYDTITNADGIKVPISGSTIVDEYEASNGRVYVLNKSNILLKEKIQPIIIEGEDYSGVSSSSSVYKRNRSWASGLYDIMVNCKNYQSDSIHVTGSQGQDSVYKATTTFYWDASNYVANVNNFHLEYNAKVNSANYKIYYVAYDDIAWHYSDAEKTFRLKQKMFISMPDTTALDYGSGTYASAVQNNYLGDKVCFVGIDTAGVYKLTKLTKWNLANNTTQLISSEFTTSDADVMTVPTWGTLTMWLCNTAESTSASAQGMMFIDYIKLVPILPAE